MDQLSLTLVTDRAQTGGRDLVTVISECLAAGLPAVQVREKDLSARDLAVLCRRLRNLTRDTGALLTVNDRLDVALAVGADAVQRSSISLDVKDMRDIAGRQLRIGASVHSLEEARDAEKNGADWVVFGPVYDTPSKRAYGAPQGVERLAIVARRLKIPVLAIGGITPERVPEVIAAGAHGVAVISGILAADSPSDATQLYLKALGGRGRRTPRVRRKSSTS
ncbi:MAG TPA: thiamine phosphate synthase [Candidatus Binatia bacterium]|nr:thiamine phosphate synthase [Candidatus Binatia bacterium]